jgi:hypothetical protein
LLSLFLLIGRGLRGGYECKLSCSALLEACHPSHRTNLLSELSIVKQATAAGVTAKHQDGANSAWNIWIAFCQDLQCDPYLSTLDYPIPLLQIFAHRYSSGALAPSGSPVKSRTVEDALRAVGQTFATLGCPDPRLQPSGKLDFRLSRQLSSYSKVDPPPTRVKPIPLPVIAQAARLCYLANTAASCTIADMLLLGFFFLLRPGEYAYTDNENAAPFCVCDVHLLIHNRRLNAYTAPQRDLDQVNFIALEFTNQKNGVRGELVGLGKSGHPQWCPVRAVLNRICHLRTHRAPPTTPLYAHYTTSWHRINTTILTTQLRIAVTTLGAQYGIMPEDISVHSLRSSGAMALLCANVDTDKIRLLGRWRSDEMLRYLHVQALPIVAPFASQMLQHGHFTSLPNHRG